MVSDTTLMFMPANGLADSMNQRSSAICLSRDSVLGWSSPTHFWIAASRPACAAGSGRGGGCVPPLPPPPSSFLPHPHAPASAAASTATRAGPMEDNDLRVRCIGLLLALVRPHHDHAEYVTEEQDEQEIDERECGRRAEIELAHGQAGQE